MNFDVGKFYSDLSQIGKILFIAAFVMIFLALMDQLVLGPIVYRLNVMDAEIEARKETIRRNLRILTFKDNILSEYENFKGYLDAGDKSQEEIIGSLLRKIEMFAKQNTIAIINVRPGDVQENPVFQEYKTTLECEGTLPNVLMFMKTLEESDYLFQITRYNLIPKSKGSEVLKVDMDIARILVQAEKDAPGEASTMDTPFDGTAPNAKEPESTPPLPERRPTEINETASVAPADAGTEAPLASEKVP